MGAVGTVGSGNVSDNNIVTMRLPNGQSTVVSGDISFPQMMDVMDKVGNHINFGKITTILPKGYMPETAKKNDLDKLVDNYNVKQVVVDMYRDKSGANDLKRLFNLGFQIQAQYLGEADPNSKIPPKDWYYMIRNK